MGNLHRVFISSTWLDLQPEREAIENALNQMKNTSFAGMEYFGSVPETPREVSLAQIDRSNVYIGIFAHRYGSGITEAEYRRALERHIPCLIYFKDHSVPVLPEHIESDGTKAARLLSLKQELRNSHTISNFKTPDQLASRVVIDLHNHALTERETKAAEYISKHQSDITDSEGIVPGGRAQVVQQSGSPILSDKTGLDSVRLKQLADNLNQDLALLKKYEDALRYEDDPRRSEKNSREIEALRTSMEKYQREYADLQADSRSDSAKQFEVVGGRLHELQATFSGVDIKKELGELRAALLSRYDNDQRTIITTVLERLDKEQLDATQTVLDAIGKMKLTESEIQDILVAVRSALAELQRQTNARSNHITPSKVKQIDEIMDAPKLDLKSKLKLSAPIIPFILSYESELELKNSANLEVVWKRLLAKTDGETGPRASKRYIAVVFTILVTSVATVIAILWPPLPDCTQKANEFKEEFINLNEWNVNSNWSIKGGENDSTGRLYLENAPTVGFAKKVCCSNFRMVFHLELLNGEGAAWALRVKDSSNYYLFYLSGVKKRFFAYVVQDNRFDPDTPESTQPVIPILKAGSHYRIIINAMNEEIYHEIVPIDTNTRDDGRQITLDHFTNAKLFSAGSIGFRTLGSETFSIDEIVVVPSNN